MGSSRMTPSSYTPLLLALSSPIVFLLLSLQAGPGHASRGEEALVEFPQYEEQGVFYPAKRSLTKLTDPCMLHRLTVSELFHIVKEEVTKFETCLRQHNVSFWFILSGGLRKLEMKIILNKEVHFQDQCINTNCKFAIFFQVA